MARFWAGVDGCRTGWVMVTIDGRGRPCLVQVRRTFSEIVIDTLGAELTLVDIPIGLPSAQERQGRICDLLARKLLKPRASRVFPVPCREAVWAANYGDACDMNYEILGKRLSAQSWAISHKIREVDSILRFQPKLRRRIRETHPELCFRFINKGRPIVESKKDKQGQQVRINLLTRYVPSTRHFLQETRIRYPAKWLAIDDMLDALAAAVLAQLACRGEVAPLPKRKKRDRFGMAMEMIGVEHNALEP